jgi:hypothetical protein
MLLRGHNQFALNWSRALIGSPLGIPQKKILGGWVAVGYLYPFITDP